VKNTSNASKLPSKPHNNTLKNRIKLPAIKNLIKKDKQKKSHKIIQNNLKQVAPSLVNPHPIVVDVRPEHEIMFIKQRKRNKFIHKAPFISKKNFDKLANIALKTAPDNYTSEEYKQRIQTSFQTSQQYFKKQNKTTRNQKPYQKRQAKKNHTKLFKTIITSVKIRAKSRTFYFLAKEKNKLLKTKFNFAIRPIPIPLLLIVML